METGRVGGDGSADRGSPKALREAREARPKDSEQSVGGLREAKIKEGRTPSDTAKAPAGEARKTTYTVQKGDTLFSIAKRFKVEVAQLRQWNKLDKKGALKPGQTIVVVLTETPSKAS